MFNTICERLKLQKFSKSEDGSLAILMGISMMFIVLLIAVAVDIAETNRARVNFQNALDAGTLAAAKIIAADNDKVAALAAGKRVFAANLGNLDPSKGVFDVDSDVAGCSGGAIVGSATLDHQVFFDIFHNISDHSGREDHIKLDGTTSVACGNDSVEIALVLDNSGSMAGDKLTALKEASVDLVDGLHNSMSESPLADPVKFALVPFSSSVNIGTSYVDTNDISKGLDEKGKSPIHFENFNMNINPHVESFAGAWKSISTGDWVTRFSFFDGLNVDWGGCVEARAHPLNTTDEKPEESDPETLFVPMFAPDEPDNWNKNWSVKAVMSSSKETCTNWQSKWKNGKLRKNRHCTKWSDDHYGKKHPQDLSYKPKYNDNIEYANGVYVGAPGTPIVTWVNDEKISEVSYNNSYMADDTNFPLAGDRANATHNTGHASGGQIKRQSWTWKYAKLANGNYPSVTNAYYSTIPKGPNFMCNSQAVQPLTGDRETVVEAINDMTALGATAISQGTVWGWRVLSPSEPFTEGRETAARNNKKIMIIMSDGNNTYYPGNQENKSLYGTHGYNSIGRIWQGLAGLVGAANTQANMRAAMDIHLAQTCENAKNDGISIFTIAFEVPNGSSVKAMLNACSSLDNTGQPQYYNADDKDALIESFEDIAKKLSDLTITQ